MQNFLKGCDCIRGYVRHTIVSQRKIITRFVGGEERFY